MDMIRTLVRAVLCGILLAGSACDNKPPVPTTGKAGANPGGNLIDTSGDAPPRVEFPESVRVENASLNEFIEDVLGSCARGDYQRYRLAVSSQYEPMTRQRFELAWHTVRLVQVRKIKLVYTPTSQAQDPARTDIRPEFRNPIYCIHATITLKERAKRPVREVVVLVVRENDRWKLGGPAPLRLKYEIMGVPPPAGTGEAPADDLVEKAVEGADAAATRPAATRGAE